MKEFTKKVKRNASITTFVWRNTSLLYNLVYSERKHLRARN